MSDPFIGEIRPFAFGIVPRGWAPCNGQLLNINQNQALFALLGTRYGGNGVTTFALPNLQGRTPIHPSDSISLAQIGGEETHTLTINEIPVHTHQVMASTDNATLPAASGNTWGNTGVRKIYAASSNATMSSTAIGASGGSQAHNNMQPYTAVQFCIALQGIWPPRN